MIKAEVIVTLKDGILDPEGKTITRALGGVGIEGIAEIGTGKYFLLQLNTNNIEMARSSTEAVCEKLLSNPVIEKYTYKIIEE